MANNVLNRLTVSGTDEIISKVYDFVKGDNTLIDFNRIVPMPESLDIPESTNTAEAEAYVIVHERMGLDPRPYCYNKFPHYDSIKGDSEKLEQYLQLGRQANDNRMKYHFPTWYEWRRKYWGTKWNSYDTERIDDQTIVFMTAWNGVPDLMQVLASKFPDAVIEYEFGDDVNNCGSYSFYNGTTEDRSPEPCSAEAYELCFDLGLIFDRHFKVRLPCICYKTNA